MQHAKRVGFISGGWRAALGLPWGPWAKPLVGDQGVKPLESVGFFNKVWQLLLRGPVAQLIISLISLICVFCVTVSAGALFFNFNG